LDEKEAVGREGTKRGELEPLLLDDSIHHDSLPFSLFLQISPSPVPMDSILSRLAQLEQQAHLQDSFNAQLNSTNEAQASTIALLSSEIGTLKKINKDQELVIGELLRASIPGGHWVWESGLKEGGEEEEEGGWIWSLVRLFSCSSFLICFSSRKIFLLG